MVDSVIERSRTLPTPEASYEVQEELRSLPRPVLLEAGALHGADLSGADLRSTYVKRADGSVEKLEDILIRRDLYEYQELFGRCCFGDENTIYSDDPERQLLIAEYLERQHIPNQPYLPKRSYAAAAIDFRVEGTEFDSSSPRL